MSEKDRIEIGRLFAGIADKMLVDFDQIQSQVAHAGERGSQRERTLMMFLEKYLPTRYALGSGHIIDTDGNRSNQCDIVIYDGHNCPLLLAEDGYQVFPIESVFGVIEVKSVAQSSTIKEAVDNIVAAKMLGEKKGIVGGLFAYRSAYRSEPPIKAVGEALTNHQKEVDGKYWIDVATVLTDGVIQRFTTPLNSDNQSQIGLRMFYELKTSALLFFLSTLINMLEKSKTTLPDLVSYGVDPDWREIGTVIVWVPDEMEEPDI